MKQHDAITKLIQAAPLLAAIAEEQSFSLAAEKLGVHQSAISHRIKSLEDSLGLTLFERTTRKIRLTESGEILCHAATKTVANWTSALDQLEKSHTTNSTRISVASSLAMKWLIPAIPNAQKMALDISLEVKDEHIDLHANEADAAIRFGRGPYPGLHSAHLSHCYLQPVASSMYIENTAAPAELISNPSTIFLSDKHGETDTTDFNWSHYFTAMGIDIKHSETGFQFDRADLMLQAAINGIGISLGRTLLIEADLKAGFLETIGDPVKLQSSYWLVCTTGFAETDRYKRLHAWLKKEVSITLSDN